jgi:hypothetical protein
MDDKGRNQAAAWKVTCAPVMADSYIHAAAFSYCSAYRRLAAVLERCVEQVSFAAPELVKQVSCSTL